MAGRSFPRVAPGGIVRAEHVNTLYDAATTDDARWDAVPSVVRDELADNQTVVDAAAAAVDANPTIADHETRISRNQTRGPWDAREWGIEADGNNHAADFALMASELATEDNRAVQLPGGDIGVDSTISTTTRGLRLIGAAGERTNTDGGTRILYTGTGALLEFGSDKGGNWSAGDYDGIPAWGLERLSLKYTGATTAALANGWGNYGTGTYAIRDWRGGDSLLDDVLIENFEYGFWGIQADIMRWERVKMRYNHVAAYLGPRCDQLTSIHAYSFNNDTLLDLDRVRQARFIGMQTVDDGSATTPPIRIHSDWGVGSNGIAFENCWFEHGSMYMGTIPAFIEVGIGDSVTSKNITINNPYIDLNNDSFSITPALTTALVRVDNGDRISITNPTGTAHQLRALVQNVGTHNPRISVTGGTGEGSNLAVENLSTGEAVVSTRIWGDDSSASPTVLLSATIDTSETGVPHGLPSTPSVQGIVPKSDARVWESSPADAENVYLTASASTLADVMLGGGSAMQAMSSLIQKDTFTDTNGTALTSHTPDTGTTWQGAAWSPEIQSNLVAATGDFQRTYINTGNTDHRTAITVNLGDDGGKRTAGAVFRAVDTSNYWFLALERDTANNPASRLNLTHVVAGSLTLVMRKYLDIQPNTDYRLVVEVRGDMFTASVDGIPSLTYEGLNDVHPAGTNAGFAIIYRGSGASTATVDNAEVRKA